MFAVAPIYLAAMMISYAIVTLPLHWLEWKAEARYGLSRKSAGKWLAHFCTESAVALVFGVAFFCVVYASVFIAGAWWWLAAGLVALGGDLFVRRLLLQKLISLRHRLRPVANPDLLQKLQSLVEKSGSKIKTFLEVRLKQETPAANAMIGGLGRKKAIFLTDTLLDAFSEEEVESVAAHELGHDRHFHLSTGVLLNFVWVTSSLLFAHVGLRILSPVFPRLGIRESADVATFPLLALFLLLFGLITTPVSGAISRRMEGKADAFAVRLGGNPRAFSAALEKLAEMNLIDPDPPWFARLISRSPPLRERIEKANAIRHHEVQA